jgi:hypothetical protein
VVRACFVLLAIAALLGAGASVGVGVGVGAASAAPDPLCTGNYARARPRAGAALRFGIDPGIAGSTGNLQRPAVSDNPRRELAALRRLRSPERGLVLRLNRLFWSDGNAAVQRFKRAAERYARAGFDVEIQVRYHPGAGEAGNLDAWRRYVRHVVDVFSRNRRVVAMTITNEVNVAISPNTSDGYYPRAEDALISGIETAHREALRRGDRQLRFGFTFAYRFVPSQDAAFFSYLRAHGGRKLTRALGFVGLDFYPDTVYPLAIAPGDSYRTEFAQAAGVLRNCFAPLAGIGRRVPIWITENGVPSGTDADDAQATALRQLVHAARDYSGTFNITDYRWFNLRDSISNPAVAPFSFASDGLLRADYGRKPSFAAYRQLIEQLGARVPVPRAW